MTKFIDPPPDPGTKVDDAPPDNSGATRLGVNFIWHNWFTRLRAFVNDLSARIDAIVIPVVPTIFTGGMVPYYIAAGDTFIVPVYKQAPFAMTIDVQGFLVVDGFLILVD